MTASQMKLIHPLRIADGRTGVRHVFIRDLVVPCVIGVHSHERDVAQRIRINIDMAVREGEGRLDDNIASVVCYEKVASGVRTIAAAARVKLVETLAEDIASLCLEDKRVRSTRVRVEKLDVFADAASAGIEIERFNPEV